MANTAHPRPRRVGVLDLGSNTILLLVLAGDGSVIRDDARITRLGQGVFERGELAPEALARTRAAITDFAQLARAEGVERLVAVGTEALRRARGGAEVLAGLVREGQVDGARLLSGEEEAELAVEATRIGVGARGAALAVIDVGGGSTEVAWRETRGGALRGMSLPLGSVRLHAWIEGLAHLGVAERRRLPGLEPGRADVIVAGLVCLELALLRLRAERFTVSERGVRHGVALRMLAGQKI